MKIKIIRLPAFHEGAYILPLSISHIYSHLKQNGFDISQEDLNIDHYPYDPNAILRKRAELLPIFFDSSALKTYLEHGKNRKLDAFTKQYIRNIVFDDVDILLLSIASVDLCSSIMGLFIAKFFKSKYPDRLVVMGGEWLQRAYILEDFELYNKLGLVDYYIEGYGELPLKLLLGRIVKKETTSLEEIPGLYWRHGGQIKHNIEWPKFELIAPDFSGLSLKHYRWNKSNFFTRISKEAFFNTEVLILPFRIISGCPNRCAFCVSCFRKTKICYFDPHEAVEILKRLSITYKTKYFFFMNDYINITGKWINDFCEAIINSNLKIYWSDCATSIGIDNPDILKRMRKAGACRLIFGLETASPRLLNLINKSVSPEQVSLALSWAHQAGIWTGVEIIAGLPHETEEDLNKTSDFINSNIRYIDDIWLNKFQLRHGSDMLVYPHNYGIDNVRDMGKNTANLREDEITRYAFDEIGGLKWADKEKQIERANGIIFNSISEKGRLPWGMPSEDINVLFYLYSYLSDKNEIRLYLEQYRKWAWSRPFYKRVIRKVLKLMPQVAI